jgi:hypothetical protein
MSTINATMTTAAIATMETVEAATTTRTFSPLAVLENLWGGWKRAGVGKFHREPPEGSPRRALASPLRSERLARPRCAR